MLVPDKVGRKTVYVTAELDAEEVCKNWGFICIRVKDGSMRFTHEGCEGEIIPLYEDEACLSPRTEVLREERSR